MFETNTKNSSHPTLIHTKILFFKELESFRRESIGVDKNRVGLKLMMKSWRLNCLVHIKAVHQFSIKYLKDTANNARTTWRTKTHHHSTFFTD